MHFAIRDSSEAQQWLCVGRAGSLTDGHTTDRVTTLTQPPHSLPLPEGGEVTVIRTSGRMDQRFVLRTRNEEGRWVAAAAAFFSAVACSRNAAIDFSRASSFVMP